MFANLMSQEALNNSRCLIFFNMIFKMIEMVSFLDLQMEVWQKNDRRLLEKGFCLLLHLNKAVISSLPENISFVRPTLTGCTNSLLYAQCMINPSPAEPGYALPLQTV